VFLKWCRGLRPVFLSVATSVALLAACDSATSAEPSDGRCPQTFEFGNYGCARLVAIARAPDGLLPTRTRLEVALRPISRESGWEGAVAMDTALRPVQVTATLLLRPLSGAVDTVSVWVVASLRDASVATWPLLATDSARYLLRFKPVGAIPRLDSVVLQLRRP
jgi:hypothetical protein